MGVITSIMAIVGLMLGYDERDKDETISSGQINKEEICFEESQNYLDYYNDSVKAKTEFLDM